MSCTGDCCSCFGLDEDVQLEIMNGTDEESRVIRHMLIPFGDGTFTCRHWDPQTKLCEIYEDRPTMCRTFPEKEEQTENGGCGRKGCSA